MNLDISSRIVFLSDRYYAITTITTNNIEHTNMKSCNTVKDAYIENLLIHSAFITCAINKLVLDQNDDITDDLHFFSMCFSS